MSNLCGGISRQYYSHDLTLTTRVFCVVLMMVAHVAAGRDINRWSTMTTSDTVVDDGSSIFSRDELVQMAGYGEDKLSTVLITGTVVCKRNAGDNHHRVSFTQPIIPVSGAIVAATCRGSRQNDDARNNKEEEEAETVTDSYGEFTIDLPSHLHAIPDIDKACSLKIKSIPHNNNNNNNKKYPCQFVITDLTKGLQLSFSGNGVRSYSAGTIEFMPKQQS